MKKQDRIMFATLEGYSSEYLRLNNNVKPYHIVAKQYDNSSVFVEDVNAIGFLNKLSELKGTTKVYFKNGGDYLQFLLPAIYELYKDKNINVSMSETGKIYKVAIKFNKRIDGKPKQYTHYLIGVESIWPLTMEGMAESVGMEYKVATRYNFIDTFETIEDFKNFENGDNYNCNNNDVDILIAFAQQTWNIVPMEDYSQTLASTAMKMWRETNPDDSRGMTLWMKYKEKEVWHTDHELWKTVKRAHKGGFVYAHPNRQLEMLSEVHDYDINSMYSNTMMNDKLPYGYPNFNNHKDYTYKIYKVKINNAVAKTVPFIATEYNTMDNAVMLHNSLDGAGKIISKDNEYKRHLKGMEVVMNNYMLELFMELYTDLDIKVEFVVNFKEKYGMFNRFLSGLIELKENANGAERELIKGVLNSITGKFSQNIMEKSVNIIKESDLEEPIKTSFKGEKTYQGQRVSVNNGLVFIKEDKGVKNNISYIPLGEAITSKSKIRLIRDIHNNWKNFVYCDTDGFMTLGPAIGLDIDNNKVGKYKFQGKWEKVVVRRPKHYACSGLMEDKNGVIEPINGKYTGYQLKGGGFQVKNFNETNLPLSTYIEPNFVVTEGTLNKLIVNGGVVFWNSKFTFDMPNKWILKQFENKKKTYEDEEKFIKDIIKVWKEKETKEWDIQSQEWIVRKSKVLQEEN